MPDGVRQKDRMKDSRHRSSSVRSLHYLLVLIRTGYTCITVAYAFQLGVAPRAVDNYLPLALLFCQRKRNRFKSGVPQGLGYLLMMGRNLRPVSKASFDFRDWAMR
jgi:hypothetical protein